MREAATRAHPRETGGILVGVLADSGPWVTHACEVASVEAGPARYVLPAGTTRILVEEMRRADARLGYLGDWHTHPRDAAASDVDRRTLRRLTGIDSPDTGETVLLVVRRRGREYVVDAHLADRRGVREAAVVRTGDLT